MIDKLLPAALALLSLTANAGELDKIAAYAGTWKIQIQTFDTAHSKAADDNSTLHNDCWRSGEFYACHQIVNGNSAALLVFTYSHKDGDYHSIAIPSGGGEPGSGTLRIAGDTWTYPWQQQDSGQTVQFRVVNIFHGPSRIEYRREYSTDGQHWTLMAKGEEQKIE